MVLHGRRLHEVRGRTDERAAEPAVEGDAGAAQRVDDDAGRVGGVPDLELELEVEGDVAEVAALDADVGPLAILEPRHVVGRSDVHVVGRQWLVELAGDGLRLRDLLRLEPFALEHVLEVHVAAEVELIGAVDGQPAVLEETGEDAVDDRGPDLALDVVTDDRHAGLREPGGPHRVAGDEDRYGVDERDPGIEAGLGVVLLGRLGPDGEVGDEDLGARPAQGGGHVDGFEQRLLDRLAVIVAQPVEGRAPLHLHPELADRCEADRVVLAREDRLAQVGADLGGVDVEGGDELDVAHVVAAELRVHQARDVVGRIGVAVVLDPLHE